jgi:cell division protein ZapA (FtsZ GTPase activity inhibitor)
MMRDATSETALDAAARRLDQALARLESRMGAAMTSAKAEAKAEVGGLFDHDRSQLASELDAARARERELKAAGQEAAEALDRAIAEIRHALSSNAEA